MLFLLASLTVVAAEPSRPHIVFILADDLGWNDVSFHGSNEIFTPNIDALAYNGIILKNHYSESLCSPSRSALLTGKYPIHTGMQHSVIFESEARGLPLSEKLIPQYLKPLGYKTHAVGKWHLGFFKKEYTPPYRGFDSFYGLWNGYHDYYKHNTQAWFLPFDGYDMRRNMTVDWSALGKYSTDLFTDEAVKIISEHDTSSPLFLYLAQLAPHAATYEDPLQAPQEEIQKLSHIKNMDRRKYAAMVSKLDESVGKVVQALAEKSMLQNSVIVFVSDNGAPSTGLMKNHGSNWPLKGEKYTPWEGGIKTVGCVWSNYLSKKKVSTQMMHISDWLPTLYHAAGGNVNDLKNLDGKNRWPVLAGEEDENPDETILHNIDDSIIGYASIRHGSYKYVTGTTLLGYLDLWSGYSPHQQPYPISKILESNCSRYLSDTEPLTEQHVTTLRSMIAIACANFTRTSRTSCHPLIEPCIFDIENDPCEWKNLYDSPQMEQIKVQLEYKLNNYRKTVVKAPVLRKSKLANPALYNDTWVNWGDYVENTMFDWIF